MFANQISQRLGNLCQATRSFPVRRTCNCSMDQRGGTRAPKANHAKPSAPQRRIDPQYHLLGASGGRDSFLQHRHSRPARSTKPFLHLLELLSRNAHHRHSAKRCKLTKGQNYCSNQQGRCFCHLCTGAKSQSRLLVHKSRVAFYGILWCIALEKARQGRTAVSPKTLIY